MTGDRTTGRRTAGPRALVFAVLCAAALATLVSGCGRRGPLEPPGTPPAAERPSSPAALFDGEEPPEPPPPDRDFVLDPLLDI